MKINRISVTKKLFNISMIVQIILWPTLAVLSFLFYQKSLLISAMLLLNGFGFFVSLIIFNKNLFFKICVLLFLIANILLTIADQMGFVDYAILVLNFICLAFAINLIIASRQDK